MRPKVGVRKKDRFEVFKRDNFTCQYCGRKAPDVVLELDHIHPASKGGKNSLLNYVTACKECNSGKGDRLLSDDAAIEKQRMQMDELAARREQLRMMAQWQTELVGIDAEAVANLTKLWEQCIPGWSTNPSGVDRIRKAYSKFGFQDVATAIRIASDQYLQSDTNGKLAPESIHAAFGKIYGICVIRSREKTDPDASKPAYIRGILRKRLAYVNERMVFPVIKTARANGISWDRIQEIACTASSWTDFCESLKIG